MQRCFRLHVSHGQSHKHTHKHIQLRSPTFCVAAGRQDGARRSENIRQVPGKTFHLFLAGFLPPSSPPRPQKQNIISPSAYLNLLHGDGDAFDGSVDVILWKFKAASFAIGKSGCAWSFHNTRVLRARLLCSPPHHTSPYRRQDARLRFSQDGEGGGNIRGMVRVSVYTSGTCPFVAPNVVP